MENTTIAVSGIVGFAVYPFAMDGLAQILSRGTSRRRQRHRYLAVFTGLGMIPVALMVVGAGRDKTPSVTFVAALVLVLCCYSTGAVIGSTIDRQREEG